MKYPNVKIISKQGISDYNRDVYHYDMFPHKLHIDPTDVFVGLISRPKNVIRPMMYESSNHKDRFRFGMYDKFGIGRVPIKSRSIESYMIDKYIRPIIRCSCVFPDTLHTL